MDVEIAFKMVGAIAASVVAALGIGKFVYDVLIGYASHRRESYKFSKDFLESVKKTENMHPFVLEKGYQAIAGDSTLKTEEIKYLLSLKNASQAMKDYILGKRYLQYLPDTEKLQIAFKDKYKSNWSRRWRVIAYFILYIILCILATSPLIFSSVFPKKLDNLFFIFILFLLYFGGFAFLALRAGMRITRAAKLVTSQDKHSEISLTKSIRKASRKRL